MEGSGNVLLPSDISKFLKELEEKHSKQAETVLLEGFLKRGP